MSQHGPPSPPVPGAAPGDKDFPGGLNRPAPPPVPPDVPNAGTAPRTGRVADEAFVRALYAEHGGALLRYALHLTGGDRQRAEDLVQETIVRAWRHPDALTDRPARPWLFAVARNLAGHGCSPWPATLLSIPTARGRPGRRRPGRQPWNCCPPTTMPTARSSRGPSPTPWLRCGRITGA